MGEPMKQRGSMAKGALESKKFIGFVIASFLWTILIGIGMWRWLPLDQWSTTLLLGMVIVLGTVEIGYIVGQAGLDTFTSLFEVLLEIFGGPKKPKSDPPPPDTSGG
jgi:Na+/citrate or Na+/malate symporter